MPSTTPLETDWWPPEIWQLLKRLVDQAQQLNRTREPQVRLTPENFPDYRSPTSHYRQDFNDVLVRLEQAAAIQVEWAKNSGRVAEKVRAPRVGIPEIERLLAEHPVFQVKRPRVSAEQIVRQHGDVFRLAFEQYKVLGLRTLAHVVLGDSHALDDIDVQALRVALDVTEQQLWVGNDAPSQEYLVRVAGDLALAGSHFEYHPRWAVPGHYLNLWPWEQAQLQVRHVGQRVMLCENTYAYWELMRRWRGSEWALICLHGETRFSAGYATALAALLARIYVHQPSIETYIWCDPDPGGLAIATRAAELVRGSGGIPQFWKMGPEVFDDLKHIVLASEKLKSLSVAQRKDLDGQTIDAELEPLRQIILDRNVCGEQEGLVALLR